MDKLIKKIKDNKIETVFIIIVLLIFILLTVDFSPKEEKTTKNTNKKVETKEEIKKVMVDIKGAVNNPGVFEMNDSDRVIDVIKKAGGLKENADTTLINLSKKVTDEMVITIYTKEEMKEKDQECPPCECPETNDACVSDAQTADTDKESAENKTSNDNVSKSPTGKISINTASLEELQTLDGIGETKAKAIIGYRETNGAFKNIEEIKNVSGIGDATYEKIKDDITI